MSADATQLKNGVVHASLQRPEQRNALNLDLLRGLNQKVGAFLRRGEVQALVLTGDGGYFSAGADLKEMKESRAAGSEGQARMKQAMGEFVYLMTNLSTLPQPTVALVDGGASGGGVGLLASCQWVIAQRDATFQLPEAGIGLFPFMISPPLIRRMGYQSFLEMTFGSKKYSAGEAQSIGLVDEVVDKLPHPETFAEREARPQTVWPNPEAEPLDVETLLEPYSKLPDDLMQAARTAALLHETMALPIAMRTGAMELGNLVSRMGEG